MELPTSLSYLKLPSKTPIMMHTNHPTYPTRQRFSTRKVVSRASKDDHFRRGRGELVDENMIVLRMRIKEMKMLDDDDDDQVPATASDWMEWEKKYFTTYYNEDIVAGMGLLQSCLMNTRPSLALGMLGVVALSVPISTAFLILQVMELVQSLISGFHIP